MRPEFSPPAPILLLFLLFAVQLFYGPPPAAAEICGKWGDAKKVGTLDHLQINEASGIAVSRRFPGRLYHVNDSGGGPYFYVSGMEARGAKPVRISGYESRRSDFEDMTLGECSPGKSCIFIGDIGDNRKRREYAEIIVIEELQDFGSMTAPLKRIKIAYPDGPHNAEGLAIHPGGDIFILTKEEEKDLTKAYPAHLYRLPKDKWKNAEEEVITLESMGKIDLPSLLPNASPLGQVVTSLDIAPDGKKFLVLTYEDAVEFGTDLSAGKLKPAAKMTEGKDYRVVEITSLPQQESVAYVEGGTGFIYDTEHHLFEVPIMRVDCVGAEAGM